MKNKLTLLLLPLLSLLTHCSSHTPSGSTSSKHPLPVLSSPSRAKAWGPATIEKKPHGYLSTYTNPANPKEILRIYGSKKLMPFFIYPPHIKGQKIVNGTPTNISQAQVWDKALLMNQSVKLYQATFASKTAAAEFHTLGTPLKDPSGINGNYRIEAEGTKNQVRTWLSELRFNP